MCVDMASGLHRTQIWQGDNEGAQLGNWSLSPYKKKCLNKDLYRMTEPPGVILIKASVLKILKITFKMMLKLILNCNDGFCIYIISKQ